MILFMAKLHSLGKYETLTNKLGSVHKTILNIN